MEIKLIETSGFVSCFNTLRKPHKLENRSETAFCIASPREPVTGFQVISIVSSISIDDKDLDLLKRLINAGDEHAKAIRLIDCTLEINAPLYFWSEMDTYEVGVTNGCSESTMHTLKKKEVIKDDFENNSVTDGAIHSLNSLIKINASIEDVKCILPSGYLQRRDIKISYQTLQRIYKQRRTHKLQCWRQFCDFIETLPLSELITNKN